MLKLKNSTTGNPNSLRANAEQFKVSFHFALTIAYILADTYNLLTLLVGCSRTHFLCNLMNLFHISGCLRLELKRKYSFSVNMGYFSPYMFFT